MGFPLELAVRYMRSKKRAFVSVGTIFAVLGVALGVAALATVMSVTGGFRAEFREKVLGVNAHVLILKYSSDFREYREVMKKVEDVPGITGIAPFVINPMMVTHGEKTATGVLLKGVDPARMPTVLDLPRHIVEGNVEGLRLTDAKPPERRRKSLFDDPTPAPKKSGADGGKSPLMLEIEKELALADDAGAPSGADAGAARADAGAPSESDAGVSEIDDEPPEDELDGGAPAGAIEPDGGFGSELPDEDLLPADVDPDPCRDPESVKKLPGIIVGKTLKENLKLELGSCVQVTSPTVGYAYSHGAVLAPVAKQFRVIAVFDAGFDQYDSKLVYTDLYEAQVFGDSGDSVTGIEMKVSDIEAARDVARKLDERLADGIYHTMDWEELNHGLFTALRIQQILMSLVLALIIVVAAFTVIATLIMVVLDKKKEIAVLKAMGASDGDLLRAFLYQGAIIGLIGATIGLGLGLLFCKGLLVYGFPLDPKVYFISRLPVQVKPLDFSLVGVFAVLVCLLATVWPAMYAARLRPAEAFREQQ
ncbi:MAG: ABC transporter permease [Polyangiaceae bacterium]|nr:ABC transporter permease [Polyangiaceae bacterium]MCE7889750.1 ABC transporter permease [Sorangiineae bacterium PRO1]MCL4750768.1 ABC transporter permease [Myxococcales bacterium]